MIRLEDNRPLLRAYVNARIALYDADSEQTITTKLRGSQAIQDGRCKATSCAFNELELGRRLPEESVQVGFGTVERFYRKDFSPWAQPR